MQIILREAEPAGVEDFLRERGWIDGSARVAAVTRAGEGNMNLVLRVALAGGGVDSVILKQARPWVEKFPDIAAPVERMEVETAFYRLAGADARLAQRLPQLLQADPEHHAALYADLGPARDFTHLYGTVGSTGHEGLAAGDAKALLEWLGHLHRLKLDTQATPELANPAMRALNRFHIFDLPLDGEHAPDADSFCPRLGESACRLRGDGALRQRLQELACEYERDGAQLLHGDFYPGSWLATDEGPVVIDPEFGFFGRAEFDLGVFIAHLHFTGSDLELLRFYSPPPDFDRRLADGFAGAELIRRLLGVAQLPLAADLAERARLLDLGRDLVLS